jgi:hypothetical protein
MKEHQVNQLNNFIGGWYIDKKVCDDLLIYFDNHPHKVPGLSGFEGKQGIHKEIKDSIDLPFPQPGVQPEIDTYLSSLQEVLNKYIEKYPMCNTYSGFSISEHPNIQSYPPGGGYKSWHAERMNSQFPYNNRHLVFMTYLNTVNDEGGTEFYHQNFKCKPEKGLTLIWPADWTFTHRGVISKTETKYITTGWFNFT